MSTFAERLKEERERLQLSQEKLGELGGVRKQAQGLYEKGVRVPDVDYILRLKDAGVDVRYLIEATRQDANAYLSQRLENSSGEEEAARESRSGNGNVAALNPRSEFMTEKEVASVVLDALFKAGRALPAEKLWAIVDAAMALQRGGITVDKSTLHEQLRLIK